MLSQVQEKTTIKISTGARIRIALAFPNTYYVGMSNLGFQTIYRLFNLCPDISCERVFLPDLSGPEKYKTRRTITSIETGRNLSSFHVIAFSLSFENDYINILTMLNLAGIHLLQKQRSRTTPLIIGGGIAAFLNPEPIADFFDLFLIGEAEKTALEFIDVLKQHHHSKLWNKPSPEIFSRINGVYVPSAYNIKFDTNSLVSKITPEQGFPDKIHASKISDLDSFTGSSCVTTPDTEFSDMALLEISRGCPRHCRFCAAGSVYKPFRIRSKTALIREINSMLSSHNKIGVLGSAVSDHPDLQAIISHIISEAGQVSISSLRADSLTMEIVELLKKSNHKNFTIAPEAGSERLRRIIRKDLTDKEIFRAIKILAAHNVTSIKLYFIIGLPGEDEEDITAIINLTKQIKNTYYIEKKGEKYLHHITVSITPFVPKPFTPFQWHSYENISSLKQKIKTISRGLKKEKKIAVSWDPPKWGYIHTLLSRGDRRVGKIILSAFEKKRNWTEAFRESDINPDFYVYRKRSFEEILPWDFIDHGIDKNKLWEEYKEALQTGGA